MKRLLLALTLGVTSLQAEVIANAPGQSGTNQVKRKGNPPGAGQPQGSAPSDGSGAIASPQSQLPSQSQPPAYSEPPAPPPGPKLSRKAQAKLDEKKRKEEAEAKALELKIQSWTAGGPTPNTDWDKYEYPPNYRGWASGDKGLGNIGNGLCTKKNAERSQMKLGYCKMIEDVLREKGSCANTAMNTIIPACNQGRFGDLHLYCSNWHALNDDAKTKAFVQVLAGLITKESGWNPNATEQPWVRQDGHHMGGMGLFQIGVEDKSKDKDCAALTPTSIFDPKTNIRCGACIALRYAARDITMGHGSGDSRAKGIAVYFSPFRDHQEKPESNKRPEIQMATQTFCRGGISQ